MGKIRAKTIGDQEAEQKEREEAEKRRLAKIEAEKAAGKARKQEVSKGSKVSNESEEEIKETKEPEETKGPHGEGQKETKEPKGTTETKNLEQKSNKSEGVTRDGEPHRAPAGEQSEPKPSDGAGQRQDLEVKAKELKKVSKYAAKVAGKGKKQRSENYLTAAKQIDKSKSYTLKEALELLEKVHLAKFDETVELHINTLTAGISGQVVLPNGTGKDVRVAIVAPSKDAEGADSLLKKIEQGKIDFDILVATPDAMPKLARVARILGPKGLMPNPKNGTISSNPEAVAKQYAGGQMHYKTEAKTPVMHVVIGKLSFGQEKLNQNITALLSAVKTENIKKVTLKSTMSPAIKLFI